MSISLRKTIMLLLAVMIVVTAPIIAYAAPEPEPAIESAVSEHDAAVRLGSPGTGVEGSMEKALIAAKNLLNIDDDVFKDFNYSSSYTNYEAGEGLLWSFNWTDNNNGYIYAVVQEDGTVLQYYKYSNLDSSFGFADVSKEAAEQIAGGFIRKAKPGTYSFYKAPDDVYISIHDSEYRMSYYADVNGYKFNAASVTININKNTGEVTGYSTSNIDPRNFDYESAADLISESQAVAAYAEKIGLRLEYRSYFDYESRKLSVFPVYLMDSGGDRYIGANTGDIVEYVYDSGVDGAAINNASGAASAPSASYDMAVSGGSAGASLTPAEIAAIDKVSSYISSEQALKKLLEAMELTDINIDAFSDKYISLNRDYYSSDRYLYDIYMYRSYARDPSTKDDEITGLSGRVDAESGRVVSFSLDYYGVPISGNEYSEEQAADAVDAFLKKIAPDEYAKSKREEDQGGAISPYNYRGDYYVNYIRYANGIVFRDNGISASFNKYSGKITRFSLNWYENASFPGIGNVLPPEKALSIFAEQNGSSINYITTGKGQAALVYEFDGGTTIDPFSGKALEYNGEPRDAGSETPDYSDVAGHWSENVVIKLLDNGVYLWGGRFEPNKVMTELEFLKYLLLLEPYYNRLEPAAFFSQRGIDIAADPDRTLTRQEAVRIIVEYLGYKKLAEQPEWFVYPFSDSVKAEYKGYVTICYMLGIIGGDNGRFNASGSITRAQAAVILQNIILFKS